MVSFTWFAALAAFLTVSVEAKRARTFSAANTRIFQQAMVDGHNYYRGLNRDTGPLVHDSALEKSAQKWAEWNCNSPQWQTHTSGGKHTDMQTAKAGGYGENLGGAWDSGQWPGDGQVIENWAGSLSYDWWSEIAYWTGQYVDSTTNHYTLMTWATTTKMGCGYCAWDMGSAKGYNTFMLCHYSPAGNQLDFKRGGSWAQGIKEREFGSPRSAGSEYRITFFKDGTVNNKPQFYKQAFLDKADVSPNFGEVNIAVVAPTKSKSVPSVGSSRYTDLGGNCRGNEIAARTTKTKEACQAQCDSLSTCAGFSFSQETSHCLVKSKACDSPVTGLSYNFYKKEAGSSGSSGESTSGTITSVPNELDVAPTGGSSFSSTYTKLNGNCGGNAITDKISINQEGCEKQCNENSQCVGYSFRIGRDHCMLKKASCSIPNARAMYTFFKKNTGGTNTFAKVAQFCRVDLPNMPLRINKTSCHRECDKNSACSAFTYQNGSDCFLKGAECSASTEFYLKN